MNKQGWSSRVHSRQASQEEFDSTVVVSTHPDAGRILTGTKECWVRDPIHFLMSSMIVIAMKEVHDQHPDQAIGFNPMFGIDFYAKSIKDSKNPYKLCHVGEMWQYYKRSRSADIIMTHAQKEWRTAEGEVKTDMVKTELRLVLHDRIMKKYMQLWEKAHPDQSFNVFKADKEFGNKGSASILFTVDRTLFNNAAEYARSKDEKICESDPDRAQEIKEIACLLKKHCAKELKDIFYEYEYIPNWLEFKNIHNPIIFIRYSVEDGPEQVYARRFVTPNYSQDASYSVPKYWPPREYKIIYDGDDASDVKVN